MSRPLRKYLVHSLAIGTRIAATGVLLGVLTLGLLFAVLSAGISAHSEAAAWLWVTSLTLGGVGLGMPVFVGLMATAHVVSRKLFFLRRPELLSLVGHEGVYALRQRKTVFVPRSRSAVEPELVARLMERGRVGIADGRVTYKCNAPSASEVSLRFRGFENGTLVDVWYAMPRQVVVDGGNGLAAFADALEVTHSIKSARSTALTHQI